MQSPRILQCQIANALQSNLLQNVEMLEQVKATGWVERELDIQFEDEELAEEFRNRLLQTISYFTLYAPLTYQYSATL